MAEIKNIQTDEICDDPKIAHLKKKQMGKFKSHALLGSIADSCKFIAGPMFAIGISTLIVGTVATSVSVALLAVAALSLAIGVGSSYAASNIWVDGQFDNYEITAKSTAHHLVQEIKSNNLCLTENKSRTDGKSWCQATAESKAAQQTMRV